MLFFSFLFFKAIPVRDQFQNLDLDLTLSLQRDLREKIGVVFFMLTTSLFRCRDRPKRKNNSSPASFFVFVFVFFVFCNTTVIHCKIMSRALRDRTTCILQNHRLLRAPFLLTANTHLKKKKPLLYNPCFECSHLRGGMTRQGSLCLFNSMGRKIHFWKAVNTLPFLSYLKIRLNFDADRYSYLTINSRKKKISA